MLVHVDADSCDSNGLCEQYAPEVFELDSEDVLRVKTESPEQRHWAAVEQAARACPKFAITVVDTE